MIMSFLWRQTTTANSSNDDKQPAVVVCPEEPDDGAVVQDNHKEIDNNNNRNRNTKLTPPPQSSSGMIAVADEKKNMMKEQEPCLDQDSGIADEPKECTLKVGHNDNNTNTNLPIMATTAAMTTTTTTTPLSPKATAISWKQAHYETCLRRGSLAVSMHQVLSLYDHVESIPKFQSSENAVLVWPEETHDSSEKEKLVSLQQSLQKLLHNEQPEASEQNNKSSLSSWLPRLYTAVVGEHPKQPLPVTATIPKEEHDDAVLYQPTTTPNHVVSSTTIKETDLLVHTDLTRRVLRLLEHLIQQQQQHATEPIVVSIPSFADWFLHSMNHGSTSRKEEEPALLDLITRLPQYQVQVLLQTLAKTKSLLLHVRDSRTPLFVLGAPTDQACQVAVALYDLTQAQASLEQSIQQAHETAAHYATKAALQYHHKKKTDSNTAAIATTTGRSQQQQSALHCMQVRKLYLQRAAQEESILLNLKKTQLTLERASQQSSLVNVLANAKDALQQLRLEQQNDVMLQEYALEMEEQESWLAHTDDTMNSSNYNCDDDDASLLQQLEECMRSGKLNEKGADGEPPVTKAASTAEERDKQSIKNLATTSAVRQPTTPVVPLPG